MEQFNIFSKPSNDFSNMLKGSGDEVFVNGAKQRAIITNPDIKEFNDKYISTTFKTVRGDYVYYQDMYWMIWNQVTVPRAESYKGLMRQAEHNVIFNLYYASVSVTSDYLLKCPAVIQRTSDYIQRYDEMMTLVDSEIHVFVKDTTSTRKINGLVGIPNGQIVIGERNYDIVGVSYEKKGYLDITCRMGTRNSSTDYVNNIYWGEGKPADWADNYDLTFYEREGVSTLPLAPDNYQTSLTVSATSTAHLSETAGTVIATWTAETNKQTYANFEGYKVRLLADKTEVAMELLGVDVLTYTFNNVSVGDYTVEVYARFAENNTILPQITTITVEDASTPVVPKPSDEVTQVTATAYNDTYNGTLVWTPEVDKNKYSGFSGYRVEVYTSSLWGGDTLQDYWVVTTEQCNIRTGWSGENGWYVTIQSIFYTPDEQLMQPYRINGDALTALPDEEGGWSPW
ncbi:cell surface protein [Priestia megaterium]